MDDKDKPTVLLQYYLKKLKLSTMLNEYALVAELLFEVISHAYEYQNLIVTSNLPFDQWTTIFGCERLTGALLDRLTHRCHILEANGESYRLRQVRKKDDWPPLPI